MTGFADNARRIIAPSLRYEVRQAVGRIRLQAARAQFWRWERVRLLRADDPAFPIDFAGRVGERWQVCSIMGLPSDVEAVPSGDRGSPRAVHFSEVPIPGALQVPWRVHSVVELGRPVEEIVARYDAELRRKLRKLAATAETRRVAEDAEVERVNRDMLEVYGTMRHAFAINFPPHTVRRIAKVTGRLDLVLVGQEEIACHLGFDLSRKRRRYWVTSRFGYPREVVSDEKRLRDANALNAYLALRWASDNGYDYYSMGSCVARPDDGLLQWKRRRGGAVDTLLNEGFFFVRLPFQDRARFLWGTPLFAVERGALVLHLGLPAGPSDEEIARRYREMGYQGLARVHLHCARPPGDTLLQSLYALYARHSRPPEVVAATST